MLPRTQDANDFKGLTRKSASVVSSVADIDPRLYEMKTMKA